MKLFVKIKSKNIYGIVEYIDSHCAVIAGYYIKDKLLVSEIISVRLNDVESVGYINNTNELDTLINRYIMNTQVL